MAKDTSGASAAISTALLIFIVFAVLQSIGIIKTAKGIIYIPLAILVLIYVIGLIKGIKATRKKYKTIRDFWEAAKNDPNFGKDI